MKRRNDLECADSSALFSSATCCAAPGDESPGAKAVTSHRTPGRLLLSLVLSALVLSGCNKSAESLSNAPLPEPPLVSECEPGIRGGKLVVALAGEPKTFNPIAAADPVSLDVLSRLFSGLVRLDVPTQKVLPGLAESWKVEADKKTWTFKLRKGLRWSDGRPLTANDVVFTYNGVIYNTNFMNAMREVVQIDGKTFAVSKVDDVTVKIVTPEVYAPLLQFAAAGIYILPEHKFAGAVVAGKPEMIYSLNSDPDEVVGSGPFRLKKFKKGQETILERNPCYFAVDKKGQRLPYLDTMVFTAAADQNAQSSQLLAGKSDVLESVRPEDVDRFKGEAAKGRFKVLDLGLASERDYIAFNQTTESDPKTGKPFVDAAKLKWFRSTKFRQAISFAIDRDAIVRATLLGNGEPNYAYAPQIAPWHNANVAQYPYNPARARELLAEIEIKDRNGDGQLEDAENRPIEFTLITNTGNARREKAATLIQEHLKKIGIKVSVQLVDFNSLLERLDNGNDWECHLLGWGAGPADPAFGMNVLRSSGFGHQWFPKQKTPATPWEARIDELMNLQLHTFEQSERVKHYHEVQSILAEQQPMIFLVAMKAFSAVRTDLRNVRGSTLDVNRVLWNVEELYFQK